MLIISHRANISGPNTATNGENHPNSITNVLNLGYNVEVDVRFINNKFYLGHDNPDYEVDEKFLYKPGLWVHAKNIEALQKLIDAPSNINVFYHDIDNCTLTSHRFIWSYPRETVILTSRSIAVMPELVSSWDLSKCYGVCTDFVERF